MRKRSGKFAWKDEEDTLDTQRGNGSPVVRSSIFIFEYRHTTQLHTQASQFKYDYTCALLCCRLCR